MAHITPPPLSIAESTSGVDQHGSTCRSEEPQNRRILHDISAGESFQKSAALKHEITVKKISPKNQRRQRNKSRMQHLRSALKSKGFFITTLYLSRDELAQIKRIIPQSAFSAKSALDAAVIRKAEDNKSHDHKVAAKPNSVRAEQENTGTFFDFFKVGPEERNSP